MEVCRRFHKSSPRGHTLKHRNPIHSIPFLNIHFNIILPSTTKSFSWSSSFWFPLQKISMYSSYQHTCSLPIPCQCPANSIWSTLHVMQVLIAQFLVSCYFLPATSKYLPQRIFFFTLSISCIMIQLLQCKPTNYYYYYYYYYYY